MSECMLVCDYERVRECGCVIEKERAGMTSTEGQTHTAPACERGS